MASISLKVAEAFQNDIGRGIIRIDSKAKSELGVSTGDVIKLSGKKAALAIVWQAHPDDEGINMIRMDGILRQNVGVGLGERVRIESEHAKAAKKVLLVPKEPIRYSAGFEQYVKKRLVGKPVLKGNMLPVGIFGTSIPLLVAQVFPGGAVVINEETEIKIAKEPSKEITNVPNVTYDDVGGLKDTIQKVREMIELPLRHPEIFERLGIDPPKGILLYGTPGTGKTLLAKAVANESESNFILISGAQVLSKYVGESEKAVREIFRKARLAAPCVLFIDEMDAITPRRSGRGGGGTFVTERIVDTLLTEMDGLRSLKNVVVIAATNRPDILDPALMRAGRFDRIIEIHVPNERARLQIFKIHTASMPLEKNVNLKDLAKLTEGYTGADIENVIREAGMAAIRDGTKKVTLRHFDTALKAVLPGIKKEDLESLKKFKTTAATMYR